MADRGTYLVRIMKISMAKTKTKKTMVVEEVLVRGTTRTNKVAKTKAKTGTRSLNQVPAVMFQSLVLTC